MSLFPMIPLHQCCPTIQIFCSRLEQVPKSPLHALIWLQSLREVVTVFFVFHRPRRNWGHPRSPFLQGLIRGGGWWRVTLQFQNLKCNSIGLKLSVFLDEFPMDRSRFCYCCRLRCFNGVPIYVDFTGPLILSMISYSTTSPPPLDCYLYLPGLFFQNSIIFAMLRLPLLLLLFLIPFVMG